MSENVHFLGNCRNSLHSYHQGLILCVSSRKGWQDSCNRRFTLTPNFYTDKHTNRESHGILKKHHGVWIETSWCFTSNAVAFFLNVVAKLNFVMVHKYSSGCVPEKNVGGRRVREVAGLLQPCRC